MPRDAVRWRCSCWRLPANDLAAPHPAQRVRRDATTAVRDARIAPCDAFLFRCDAFFVSRDAFCPSRDAPRDARSAQLLHPLHRGTALIPLLLSLALAGGVYLTFDGLVRPRHSAPRIQRWRAAPEFLVRARLHAGTPRAFLPFLLPPCTGPRLAAPLFPA